MSRPLQLPYLTCPFCPFGTHDLGTLETHVLRLHNDQQSRGNGPSQLSPVDDFELAQLLAFEEAGLPVELALSDRSNIPPRNETNSSEGAEQNGQASSSSPAESEASWLQCECGERVPVLELDAHSDMHAQESISIAEPEMPVKDVELQILGTTRHPSTTSLAGSFSTAIPKSLRNYDQLRPSRTPPPNEKRRGPSLKELFLGTPASPKRKSAYSAVASKLGKTKRLGVSLQISTAAGLHD
jgi:hypothetical protein